MRHSRLQLLVLEQGGGAHAHRTIITELDAELENPAVGLHEARHRRHVDVVHAGHGSAEHIEPCALWVCGGVDRHVHEELAGQVQHRGLELPVVQKVGTVHGHAPHRCGVVIEEGDAEGPRIGFAGLVL